MRRYLTIAFICMIHLPWNELLSQSIIEDGTTWTYSHYQFGSSLRTINKATVLGDTIIQGEVAKIVKRNVVSCDGRPEYDIISFHPETLRHYNFEGDTFQLLFDYNVLEGDTLTIPLWERFSLPETQFYILVDSIREVNYSGILIETYFVRYDLYDADEIEFDNGLLPGTVLREIGSLNNLTHFTENGLCHGGYNRGLRCFSNSILGEINFVDEPCDSIQTFGVGIQDELNMESIKFYPNPVVDNLYCEIGRENFEFDLAIYNSQSVMVKQQPILMGNRELNIDVDNLESGIYFLILTNGETGFNYVHKFCKIVE